MSTNVSDPCAGLRSQVVSIKGDLAEAQQELHSGEVNKTLLNKQIADLKSQLATAQAALDSCIALHPPVDNPPVNNPPPPKAIPPECQFIANNIKDMQADMAEYKRELADKGDPGINKTLLNNAIAKLQQQIYTAQAALDACILNPPTQPPTSTAPKRNTDTTPKPFTKVIPWATLQKKMDEFFNHRVGPPIFSIRLHHHDHFSSNGSIDNDPPASDVTISMVEAEVVNGAVTTAYNQISNIDLGQLDHDYYFNDVNSNGITVTLTPGNPLPIMLKITFETAGPDEMPTTNHLLPDNDFIDFYITLKLSITRIKNAANIGHLDFVSWVDDLAKLKDDALDAAIPNYIVAHITTTSKFDTGGAAQKAMRGKIYGKLSDPANRSKLNSMISRWLLGGDGSYNVTDVKNDTQNITITYNVPAGVLDPFPDNMFRPAGWPFQGNTKPDNAKYDFTPNTNLNNIKHVVVLTMENRSFDQMLGYLALPQNAGGMGRTDVDGLNKQVPNPFNGTTYMPNAFKVGDTAFDKDPAHSFGPVFRQIDGGKMDGFAKSFAIDAMAGNLGRIMGYHTAANVPVYDALARDFGICHRWFAAHPGPTFTNRFYELTGRLNLGSGLNADNPPVKFGDWELSNSSPLTPVFNKTIFDFIADYATRLDKTLTWKYYEHAYCFLRFFSKYTFDNKNIFRIDDPVNGFFQDCSRGTLPSVSFIDPQFIELPPNSNCDGPVADVKDGQALVQKVVEAVVASPAFANTLLIITYDEHGGFYDHVPPPPNAQKSADLPVDTWGVRVPAFFISPYITAGTCYGHDLDKSNKTLYFEHTSLLKTIARRFMPKDPPYMGDRMALANDLSPVLNATPRKFSFLPFIRYNFTYKASSKMLDIAGANFAPGTQAWQWDRNGTIAQDFSFEDAGNGFFRIRTHTGNNYLTVDVPSTGAVPGPGKTFNTKQDVLYDAAKTATNPKQFDPKFQQWKLTGTGVSVLDIASYIITNAAFPDKVLQPANNTQTGALVMLADKSAGAGSPNAWRVTSPVLPTPGLTGVVVGSF